jgi:hypothetical protein
VRTFRTTCNKLFSLTCSRARATSAAPTFFKPFVNSRTKEEYIDGALYHNNPIRVAVNESKLLWPDTEGRHPDILFSIGTAQHDADTDGLRESLQNEDGHKPRRHWLSRDKTPKTSKRSGTGLKLFSEWQSLATLFKRRAESVLDAEKAWREFYQEMPHAAVDRYIRINPKTKQRTPRMDDKSLVHILHDEIKIGLGVRDMPIRITKVARRLVASSFYFDKVGFSRRLDDHHIRIQGTSRSMNTRLDKYLS